MPNPEKPFSFGTKAETLEALSRLLSFSHIPPFYYFNVQTWQRERDRVCKKIQSQFTKGKLIVRSSARSEDLEHTSMAGSYDSISHVAVRNKDTLMAAIDQVIESYRKSSGEHQVLVQEMISEISMSGVVMTHDLDTGAPYYVINYDDETGRTDTVTGGAEQSHRTLFVQRDAAGDVASPRFKALLKVVSEIEAVTRSSALDIEFAVDKKNTVHIFQVRRIATRPNWNRGLALKMNDAIARIRDFVSDRRTLFGNMPDWNPAEMIGTSPRPLSLSLYRYLITDRVWRKARKQMGYHEPRGARLMVSLFGKPYIDVKLSFSSFLPAGLSQKIGEKLVHAWMLRLAEHKELHDKIEFEVCQTICSFDFDELVEEQIPGVLTPAERKEYKSALSKMTDQLLKGAVAPLSEELKKVNQLASLRIDLKQARAEPELSTVASLLEDCISLGTLPFSILARHAFIATSFLRSLVAKGVLTQDEAASFKKSIKTVASDFVQDMHRFSSGKLSREEFMHRYGHLRPGTYDILSRRYDERLTLLDAVPTLPKEALEEHTVADFAFTPKHRSAMAKLLKEFSFEITPEQLIAYIQESISAREYAKFVFTRNISDALAIIEAWGERMGLSRDELSYLSIQEILDTLTMAQGRNVEQYLRELSQSRQATHDVTTALRLPYLIEKPEDVSIIPLFVHKPNFITKKTVRGACVLLRAESEELPDLAGKIVCIESADPGFDWIFSRPIAGLVTKFGGVNSHMAIRCAEFGLPAAIGCGEQIFDRVSRSRFVELHCSQERIDICLYD